MSTGAAKTIFISYSREDEAFCRELENHLQTMKRQQLIEVWHDRNISAGTNWVQQINEYLNTADIILLLISPDFLASDYCYSVEMQRALERHKAKTAQVIPIILRPVKWEGTPFGILQALPTDGKPVTEWSTRDNAFRDVAEGIERVIRQMTLTVSTQRQKTTSIDGEAVLRRVRIGQVQPSWRVFLPSRKDMLLDSLIYFLTGVYIGFLLSLALDITLSATHVIDPYGPLANLMIPVGAALSGLVGIAPPLVWIEARHITLVLLPEGYVYGTTDPPQVESILNFQSALAVCF